MVYKMNLWILDSIKGITLLYKPFLELPVKDDLVSGLLTALNQFTLFEFNEPIDSIDMGGYKWVYILVPEYNLLFVAADSKDVNVMTLRSRLEFIQQLFITQYVINQDHWKENWKGDVELFKPFNDIVEDYYIQWQAAENIDTYANFFDIIGIFQQILNLLHDIIRNQIDFNKQDVIYKRIEKIFKEFQNRMDIIKIRELDKITYSRESGFNIININPTHIDVNVVEKLLKNLIIQIVKVIKSELGHDLSLNYFSEYNIFNYIFKNITLLKRLNIEDFFLQLFLLK